MPEGVEHWDAAVVADSPAVCHGGEGGIRTPGRGLGPYDGLANRCFRPLSHLSGVFGGSSCILPQRGMAFGPMWDMSPDLSSHQSDGRPAGQAWMPVPRRGAKPPANRRPPCAA